MPGHSFSRGLRLHSPLSEHCLYCATVTSVTSMQYGDSVTWCAGRSSFASSLSSEPMKNFPPGIWAMPAGHVGGGGGAGATDDADAVATTGGPTSLPRR